MSIDDQANIAITLAMHYLIFMRKSELDQLGEGLKSLGMLHLFSNHRELMKPLLSTGKPKVTASLMLETFQVVWSPQGSNNRDEEEAVILAWTEYVHDTES